MLERHLAVTLPPPILIEESAVHARQHGLDVTDNVFLPRQYRDVLHAMPLPVREFETSGMATKQFYIKRLDELYIDVHAI